MDLECYPSCRNDDVLYGIDVQEHPLVIGAIGPCVTKEHAVETIHEVVTTVRRMEKREGGEDFCKQSTNY